MNAAEHKAKAEDLLMALEEDAQINIDSGGWTTEDRANVIALAQVHATLATIPDGGE